MSFYDVVGIGTNSLDSVYLLPEHPRPDGPTAKLRITAHRVSPGGQTTTALCACAALGLRTSYVGAFGSDANGRRLRKEVASRGVSTDAAPTRDAPNRYAVILVDQRHGERVVLWDRDPRLALRPDELPSPLIAAAKVVHVDDEDEAIAIEAARIARGAGVPVTSDIDRVTARTRELAAAVSVPIFAEHVPAAITGIGDMERALRALRAPHHTLLCVTLGSRGAMFLDGDGLQHVPAFQVDVKDSTGAGDVFRGAFIYALLRGDKPDAILRFANAAAAVACTRHGAIGGVPSLQEIEELMAGHTKPA
ncbi:MAG TPA: PfkB family carbohydrate kinase [Vicinamibacterales bacterium]